jgi:signal transduction histidine kinase
MALECLGADGGGLLTLRVACLGCREGARPVRVHPRRPTSDDFRLRVSRLSAVPLRPITARMVTGTLATEADADDIEARLSPKTRSLCELDPGWTLARACKAETFDPLAVISATSWWPVLTNAATSEFMSRLWRHSIAVGLVAGSLARDAHDPDPESVARAGLLCRLGCWAVAAVDPEWMARWWNESDPLARRQREIKHLGTDLDDLGRRLAERWGCDPLIVDAAWLHDFDGPVLTSAAAEPRRLAYVQEACRRAEQTPWSLHAGSAPESMPVEPRLRILVAEVQARTASSFVATDSTVHEERMTRQNARLRQQLARMRQEGDRGSRFLQSLAESDPAVSPEDWAARAAMSWCAEPGVSAARVVWLDSAPVLAAANESPTVDQQPISAGPNAPSANPRPAELVLPLKARGRTRALIQLWSDRAGSFGNSQLAGCPTHLAWQSWAAMVADRAILERRVQSVVASVRASIENDEDRLGERKLAALGEFAGGAGHELNNPLAVVVGRAQLLLARTDHPETVRSLRIILSQAGRAHRILRDLMFVARPPAPRPRSCRPADLLSACVRDVQEECAARGIRLATEIDDAKPVAHLDPDALRHLGEILLRNAVQATPSGGKIIVKSSVQGDELSWSFSDSGTGIAPHEAAHLFDPFFCGRQAGRGLGLGLPRAARLVDQAGGRLRWSSNPGQGSVFQVHLPLVRRTEHADTLPAPSIPAVAGERSVKN